MIPIEQILSLIVMHLFIFIVPGPNTALIIRNTMRYGFNTGVLSAFGIASVITLHAVFAMVAANFIINEFNNYFYYIKMIGVVYVGAFGLNFVRSSFKSPLLASVSGSNIAGNQVVADTLPKAAAIRMGFLLDLFNPYIPLFYMSIAPTYLVNTDLSISIPLFGGLVSVLNMSWFSGLSYLVAFSQSYTRFKTNVQFLELFAGIAMIIFAIFLFVKN